MVIGIAWYVKPSCTIGRISDQSLGSHVAIFRIRLYACTLNLRKSCLTSSESKSINALSGEQQAT